MSKQIEKEKDTKPASVELLVRVVVKDSEGRIIKCIGSLGTKPSRSYVIAFLTFVSACMRVTTLSPTDITNTARMIYNSAGGSFQNFLINAGVGGTDRGIVIGSGVNAPTNTDYKLQTIIAHGAGAGQMSYGAQVINATGVVGANVDLIIQRTFTNNSGGDVTINEVGLYVRRDVAYAPDPPGGACTHCAIRDVLPASVTVPNMCSVTVYYTLRTTV